MAEANQQKSPNAWIAIDHGLASDLTLAPYTLQLKGERSLHQAIADDDWVLILNATGHIARVGRVLRVRSDLEATTLYFDRMLLVDPAVPIGLTSLTPPSAGSVGRIQWADFLESLPDVDALTKQVADYETAIREGVTRAAWEEEAAKLGVDPKYFDDLWKLDAPELSDEPDAKALAAHLAKSIEGRQVMLAAPSDDDDETEAEEPDEEEADSDDETEGATAGRKPMSIFDVAPPKKPAPGKAPGTPQDGPAAKPRPGRAEAPAKPQGGKLTASAGASRGSRDSQRRETVDDVVDREFAETGRTDDFRI